MPVPSVMRACEASTRATAEPPASRRAGAAKAVGHPGEREARLLQRSPRRRLPGVVLGAVDSLRIAEIAEDSRGRVDDERFTAHDARPSSRPVRPATFVSPAPYLSTTGV